MNNSTEAADTFEAIAEDAVALLVALIQDLRDEGNEDDKALATILGLATSSLCLRAIAIKEAA